MTEKKHILQFWLLAASGFVLDIGSKLWAQAALSQDWIDPEKVRPFTVRLTLAYNHGASFGMLSGVAGGRWILTLLGIAAIYFIWYMYRRPEIRFGFYRTGLALVAAGAMGNLIDRIVFGRVTDFIQMWLFRSIPITWPWPTYNVADVLLLAGVGCLLIFSFTPHSRELWASEKEKKAQRG